jgi:hypothetical protein
MMRRRRRSPFLVDVLELAKLGFSALLLGALVLELWFVLWVVAR